MITIRDFQKEDWPAVWDILRPVFRAGETYAFDPKISELESQTAWIELPRATYVALDESGTIVGTYYIKPNQPGLGAHVCNCGYVVSESARGAGIASTMCQHSLAEAVRLGFRAMQYNLVVSSNRDAIHLWQKFGFRVIGTLPGAFRHHQLGYIDALIMFQHLTD